MKHVMFCRIISLEDHINILNLYVSIKTVVLWEVTFYFIDRCQHVGGTCRLSVLGHNTFLWNDSVVTKLHGVTPEDHNLCTVCFKSTSQLIESKTLHHAGDRLYVVKWPVLELFESTRKCRIANKECYKSINNRNKCLRGDNKVHCSAWTHIWSKKKLLWVGKRTYIMKSHCTIKRKKLITKTLSRKHKT